jgi:hypothetical protein
MTTSSKKTIPRFLLVISILSLIAVLLSLLGSIYTLLSFKTTLSLLELVAQWSSRGMKDFYDNFSKYGQFLYFFKIFSSLALIYAIILMLKLRKKAYYMYVFFTVAPLVLNAVFLGFYGLSKVNTSAFGLMITAAFFGILTKVFGPFVIMLSILFPVAFIIMFATQLKHMR